MFALPKLLYSLTVLSNINEVFVKDIVDSMFKFIWDNNSDKIKRKPITKRLQKCVQWGRGGGEDLFIADTLVYHMIKSLYFKWSKTYHEEGTVQDTRHMHFFGV